MCWAVEPVEITSCFGGGRWSGDPWAVEPVDTMICFGGGRWSGDPWAVEPERFMIGGYGTPGPLSPEKI